MPRTHKADPKVLEQSRDWARKLVQMEMLRKDLTYGDLARLLNEAGIEENERNLRNKIARGEFSASFMLMCMSVVGVKGWEHAGEIVRDHLIEQQGKRKGKPS
ncbi:MAG TPA: DUF6471 domain-containing protein [Rhizomicrobium sp.]|jgi:hypothetical protein